MRILVEVPTEEQEHTALTIQSRDVILLPDFFCRPDDKSIYTQLLKEMDDCGVPGDKLWKLWHGDSHLIADDHTAFKKRCPTFSRILDEIHSYFRMKSNATRFNWYRDNTDWKPFHHDASALDPEKSKRQNFTVGVSFGATREIAFEDAKAKPEERRVISLPLPNGTVYAFAREINTEWRHGVPQVSLKNEEGRISIISWGWCDQNDLEN